MGKDKRRTLLNRAKKLARLSVRRKQRRKQQDQAASGRSVHLGVTREQLKRSPIHKTLVSAAIFEHGIGDVIISRRLPDGRVAAGVFLLDVYCLGVKSAFFTVATVSDFESRVLGRFASQELGPTSHAYARKLVVEAIAYARGLGFEPHEDFHVAAGILGDVDDSAECTEVFTFGKDGKPFYISGPHDSEAKVTRIIATLHDHCGEEGYNFLIGGPVSDQTGQPEVPQEDNAEV